MWKSSPWDGADQERRSAHCFEILNTIISERAHAQQPHDSLAPRPPAVTAAPNKPWILASPGVQPYALEVPAQPDMTCGGRMSAKGRDSRQPLRNRSHHTSGQAAGGTASAGARNAAAAGRGAVPRPTPTPPTRHPRASRSVRCSPNPSPPPPPPPAIPPRPATFRLRRRFPMAPLAPSKPPAACMTSRIVGAPSDLALAPDTPTAAGPGSAPPPVAATSLPARAPPAPAERHTHKSTPHVTPVGASNQNQNVEVMPHCVGQGTTNHPV